MVHSLQSNQEADLRAQVLASPAYQERTDLLFELFRASRQFDGNPKSLLSLQAGFAEILKNWQKKRRELKSENNQLGIAVVNRLILVLKHIVDSIAWRALGYDRLLIQLLAEHPKTGFLERTVIKEFEAARQIVDSEDAIVLINDLTTILRHGDLTIIRPDKSIDIREVKTGRKDGRASRQKKKLNELWHFLNTGSRISKDDTQDYILKVDVSVQTHHSLIANLIAQARRSGYQKMIISDCLAVEAVQMEHPHAYFPQQRPFESVERTVSFSNLDVFDKPTTRQTPYGVFPFDDRTCFNLITGSTYLIATLNFDALVHLFNQFDLTLELPQPSQQEIDEYLSASIAEVRKAQKQMKDRHNWVHIRDGDHFLRISPDNWTRISVDFIHEKTFAQTQRYLINQADRLGDSGKLERFYWGYKNESSIWS